MQNRLLLQVKAVSLLYGSEAELKAKLAQKLVHSNDESVRKFVRAMQVGAPKGTGRALVIAAGEMVMAALLVVAASLVLVPTVLGVSTYTRLEGYFAQTISGVLSGSPISPYLSVVEFAVGVALMLSAFVALHEAALGLKEAGLTVRTGEA